MSDLTQAVVVALSEWVTGSYPSDTSRESVLWRRITKVNEEAGEVVNAFAGSLGENPRKGVTHTQVDVIEELLDTAVASLGAVEELTGNNGLSMQMLDSHIIKVGMRAGVVT